MDRFKKNLVNTLVSLIIKIIFNITSKCNIRSCIIKNR